MLVIDGCKRIKGSAYLTAACLLLITMAVAPSGASDGAGRVHEQAYVSVGSELTAENCVADVPGVNCAGSVAEPGETAVSVSIDDATQQAVAFEWYWRNPASVEFYGGNHCGSTPLVIAKPYMTTVVVRFYTAHAMNVCEDFLDETGAATVGIASFTWQ